MAQRDQDELPDQVRRAYERKGVWVRASKAVPLDADDPDHVSLFHLAGVSELLSETLDTLVTCDVILANPNAIPHEQPANVLLASSIPLQSTDPAVETGFLSEIETWAQAQSRMRLLVKRMAFGHALSKFFAAMPNPDGGSKWSHKFTGQWQEANKHMIPVYDKYKDVRNWQESHRGKNEDRGGFVSSYHVLTNEYVLSRVVNTSHDPGLHFDPQADDMKALRNLSISAVRFVMSRFDTHSTPLSYQGG